MIVLDREKRLTLRALGYWRGISRDRRFPRCDDVDPSALGDDWLNCIVLKLAMPLGESRFIHVGRNLCFPPGTVLRERPLSEVPQQSVLHAATSYVSRVLEKQVPFGIDGFTVHGDGFALYRSILMPLSDSGDTIDAIFGAANFREAPMREEEFPA